MILNSTLKSIRVVLGEAITTTDCDVTASWGDYAGTQFVPGSADTVTNGTTPVEVVAAPGASEQRLVQEITVYNADSVSHTVVLQLDNNGTIRVFRAQEVSPGNMLIYAPNGAVPPDVPAALLLESGTVGVKISALPATSLGSGDYAATDVLPIVQAGETRGAPLGQLYTLFLDWLDYITANPLDAPAASNSHGLPIVIVAGAGDGSGAGGDVAINCGSAGATGVGGSFTFAAGDGGATSGNGGDLTFQSGAGIAGDSQGGGVTIASGAGSGSQNAGAIAANAGNAVDGLGGDVNFSAGTASGTGNGGNAGITGGTSGTGSSGATISADGGGADGTDFGGGVWLNGGAAGSGTGAQGGDIHLITGAGDGAGRQGLVILTNLPTSDPGVSNALWVDPVTHLIHQSP